MSNKIEILYNKLKAIADEYTDETVEDLEFIANQLYDKDDTKTPFYGNFSPGEVVECLKELLTWFGRDYSLNG